MITLVFIHTTLFPKMGLRQLYMDFFSKHALGFIQKVLAKFSKMLQCHSYEPKIVPEHLFSVTNRILIMFQIQLVIKFFHFEI